MNVAALRRTLIIGVTAGVCGLCSLGAPEASATAGSDWQVPLGSSTVTLASTAVDQVAYQDCADSAPEIAAVDQNGHTVLSVAAEATGGECQGDAPVMDAAGNVYFVTTNANGQPTIESRSQAGALRWSTPISAGWDSWRVPLVLGDDGRVYAVLFDLRSATEIVSFSQSTGTMDTPFDVGSDVEGLYAYGGGIAVVDEASSSVEYYSYAHTALGSFPVPAAIAGQYGFSISGGPDGTVFVAGHPSVQCPGASGDSGVVKFAPTGPVWSWQAPGQDACGQTRLAATPDGGVVVSAPTGTPDSPEVLVSLDAQGKQRWQHTLTYFHGAPYVDTNGTVVIAEDGRYDCGLGVCDEPFVEFLASADGSAAFPAIQFPDDIGYGAGIYGTALLSGELVDVVGDSSGNWLQGNPVDGLGLDYQTTLSDGAGKPVEYPKYVALGDSYSSGEGNPPFIASAGTCDRSRTAAWPELLAKSAPL